MYNTCFSYAKSKDRYYGLAKIQILYHFNKQSKEKIKISVNSQKPYLRNTKIKARKKKLFLRFNFLEASFILLKLSLDFSTIQVRSCLHLDE